ncbi:MAG: beta-lactamase family protein [Bacteroidetes bacterium]|jgi:CubicO group peptidase (beta-lactamase class C family)|nr:MAG: beta-lactamase family protein [Bacteroidota bacterium]
MSDKFYLSCLKSSILGGLLLFFQPVFAQYDFHDIDQEWQSRQKQLGKDAVFMLSNKDTILFKREAGDFNAKTVAPIASCSKWLTAALVMIFIDEGKLSLDDKIGKWLPEFDRYGKSYITVRLCLSHETGIKDEGSLLKKMFERRKFSSLEQEVNSFAARDIRVNAGEDFWYGNIGLNIVGRILEIISKKNFDVLIKQKLFAPLAMRRTSFSTLDGSAVNPSGGAVSSAEEYMKFLMMLLNKGKANGKQVLSEQSVETLKLVQTNSMKIAYVPKAAEGFGYALGSWAAEQKDGKATTLASPGLFGTWPMVDFCRGYAYIVFVKNLLGEEKADAHMGLKKVIDQQIPSTCK